MATIKLSGETEATAGNAADIIYVVQGGVTKKLQIGNIAGPFSNSVGFSGGLTLGSDTDVLDRHAFGTFTPTIRGGGTAGGPHTYSVQVGRWVRIGKLVYVQVALSLTALGAAMSGNAQVTGLPFAAENVANAYHGLALASMYVDLPAGYTALLPIIGPNTTVVQFMYVGDSVAQNYLQVAGILATTTLTFSGIYRAD